MYLSCAVFMHVIFHNVYNAKLTATTIHTHTQTHTHKIPNFSGQASTAYVWVMPTVRGCWPNTYHALPKLDSPENWLPNPFSHVLMVARIQCNIPSQGRSPSVFTSHPFFLPIHSLNIIILSIFYAPGVGQDATVAGMITVLTELPQCSAGWQGWVS